MRRGVVLAPAVANVFVTETVTVGVNVLPTVATVREGDNVRPTVANVFVFEIVMVGESVLPTDACVRDKVLPTDACVCEGENVRAFEATVRVRDARAVTTVRDAETVMENVRPTVATVRVTEPLTTTLTAVKPDAVAGYVPSIE